MTIAAGLEIEGSLRGILHFLRPPSRNRALDGREDTAFQSRSSTEESLRADFPFIDVRSSSDTLTMDACRCDCLHRKIWDFQHLDESGQWTIRQQAGPRGPPGALSRRAFRNRGPGACLAVFPIADDPHKSLAGLVPDDPPARYFRRSDRFQRAQALRFLFCSIMIPIIPHDN
jgi:hypothetical protein